MLHQYMYPFTNTTASSLHGFFSSNQIKQTLRFFLVFFTTGTCTCLNQREIFSHYVLFSISWINSLNMQPLKDNYIASCDTHNPVFSIIDHGIWSNHSPRQQAFPDLLLSQWKFIVLSFLSWEPLIYKYLKVLHEDGDERTEKLLTQQ